MKATVVNPLVTAEIGKTGWLAMFFDLVKVRLNSLVLLTTLVGFYMGQGGRLDFLLLFHTLIGTALVAGGASALNQFLEKDYDALMKRTRSRPLPSGRLRPEAALFFGVTSATIGMLQLALLVNPLTGLLAALTFGVYVGIYTPLKRITPLNTLVGAIPGALPPLIGWTASRGEITLEGWSLFAILFFWQLPHFMAISWLYREEYQRAGFAMLSVFDPEGARTGQQAVGHTLGLMTVSICPFLFNMAGSWYLWSALALGLMFLLSAIQFSRGLTRAQARRLFCLSVIYLPVLLGLMVFDKVR